MILVSDRDERSELAHLAAVTHTMGRVRAIYRFLLSRRPRPCHTDDSPIPRVRVGVL